jgi:nucleoside-diphosphate-sugar epimerase
MKIGITGEKGFIAVNFAKELENLGHEFVSFDNSYAMDNMNYTKTNEVCVYSNDVNDWVELFKNCEIDAVVHNAAVVGTDVVALNPDQAVCTNVLGTTKITEAANIAGILNVYIGTTVIYDTYRYQDTDITEESALYPRTNYAVQKLAGEQIVRNNADNYLIVRPLFAYGGKGDMNSLISKTLYGVKNNISNIDMFLNPEKIKDYMHVNDFCYNVIKLMETDIRNDDFNITAENPHNTQEIVSLMEEVTGQDLTSVIKWHPKTDYLGNHRLTNQKYITAIGSSRTRSLKEGIRESWESIIESDNTFNPLKHLQQAKREDVDLVRHYPNSK